MVEQLAFNQLVVGSNPTRPTIFETSSLESNLKIRRQKLCSQKAPLKGAFFLPGYSAVR
ncbi:hypothetical protein EMIT048CA2_70069 [Pseudomonas chlororaphis]